MPFRRLFPLFLLIISVMVCHAQCWNGPSGTVISHSPLYWAPGQSYNVVLTAAQPDFIQNPYPLSSFPPPAFYAVTAAAFNPANNSWPEDPNVTVGAPVLVSASEVTVAVTVSASAPTEGDALVMDCGEGAMGFYENPPVIQITPCANPATPVITSVQPSSWVVGQATNITISGSGFIPYSNANSCAPSGPGVAVPSGTISISNVNFVGTGQITATVTPAATDPAETATVLVSNPEYNTPPYALIASAPAQVVLCPPITVTAVSPNVWTAGQSYLITITGTNFVTTAAATKNCPVSTVTATTPSTNPAVTVAVSGISVVSATEITATVEATSAPNTGPPLKGGTPAPAGAIAATVEVIATPPAQSGPAPAVSAKAVALDAATAPAPNVDVLLASQIICTGEYMQCDGETISGGAAAASVIVGQTISLAATPSVDTLSNLPIGLTLVSPTNWTVGGTNIGGRPFGTPDAGDSPTTASVTPTVLTNPTLTTYWLYPGSNIPVTFEYCVDNPDVSPITVICSPTATATFDVLGPTAQITASLSSASTPPATGAWWVSPILSCDGYQFLVFGTIPTTSCIIAAAQLGIVFEITNVENVPASGGEFQWLQLKNSDVVSATEPGVTVEPTVYTTGLDDIDPYPSITDTATGDAPDISLSNQVPPLATQTRAFSAQMYLMWSTSVDPDAIQVPIGYVTWTIKGAAVQNSTSNPPWSLATSQVATTAAYTASTDTGPPYYGMPVWAKIAYGTTGESGEMPSDVKPGSIKIESEKEK